MSGFNKMDVENGCNIAEPLADELCRLCANTDQQLIPIFQGEGIEHNIAEQIDKYLPIITVTQTDELPLKICYQCTSTLIAWHNFFEQCRGADIRLREILSVDSKSNQDDESCHDCTDNFHDDFEDQASINDNPQVECVLVESTDSDLQISTVSDAQIPIVSDAQIPIVSDVQIPIVSDVQVATVDDTQTVKTSDKDSIDVNKSVTETLNDSRKCAKLRDVEDYSILIDELIIPDEMPNLMDEVNFDHKDCQLVQLTASKDCADRDLIESKVKSPSPILLLRVLRNDQILPKRVAQHRRSTHHENADSGAQPFHLADGKFQCPMCDKKFCRKLNAQQHLITHTSNKDTKCDHCSFRCYTKSQLDVHQKKHTKRYGCDLCAKMFAYKFQLDTHVQAVHYNIRPFPCNICGKTFKTRYNYGSHMAQHRDVRNFQCPHCPHRCRKSYDLRVHIRTHTGEKPFQCSHCERCYSQNSDRLKHERICLPKMKMKAALAAGSMERSDSIRGSRTKSRAKKLN